MTASVCWIWYSLPLSIKCLLSPLIIGIFFPYIELPLSEIISCRCRELVSSQCNLYCSGKSCLIITETCSSGLLQGNVTIDVIRARTHLSSIRRFPGLPWCFQGPHIIAICGPWLLLKLGCNSYVTHEQKLGGFLPNHWASPFKSVMHSWNSWKLVKGNFGVEVTFENNVKETASIISEEDWSNKTVYIDTFIIVNSFHSINCFF